MSAKEAFKAFVRAYDSHQMKTIFDIQTLDLGKLALSFGFRRPPNVGFSEYFGFLYFLH
jgi:ATP-dependent RNA helicase DDX18/HAS1